MRFIYLDIYNTDNVHWHFSKGKTFHAFESVNITVNIHFYLTNKEAVAIATDIIAYEGPDWFICGGYRWTLDLGKLKTNVEVCSDLEWLNGKITVEPEYKLQERIIFDQKEYTTSLVLSLLPEDLSRELFQKHALRNPDELLPSLSKLQQDYPSSAKNGFIIMQFSDTKAHQSILNSIRLTLKKFSLNGLRADDKEYSDELLTNIRTYIHGCSFGIAVFERLLEDDFNPNISLEVGYMMAQGKPIFFLKDKTLKNLHTDIIGKLYRNFDPQNPEGTIPDQMENWLRDKGLI